MHLLIAIRNIDEESDMGKNLKKDIQGLCPGIENIYFAYSKTGVKKACLENPQINRILVSEYLEIRNPYTPEDLNMLDEMREDLILYPILEDAHEKTPYVAALHAAAIYNAIFEKDADVSYVCELLKKSRNKKESRSYYGISGIEPVEQEEDISSGMSIERSQAFIINGKNAKEQRDRAAHVYRSLSFKEFQDVLEGLPKNVLEQIREDDRFYLFFPEKSEEESEKNNFVEKIEEIEKENVKEHSRDEHCVEDSKTNEPVLSDTVSEKVVEKKEDRKEKDFFKREKKSKPEKPVRKEEVTKRSSERTWDFGKRLEDGKEKRKKEEKVEKKKKEHMVIGVVGTSKGCGVSTAVRSLAVFMEEMAPYEEIAIIQPSFTELSFEKCFSQQIREEVREYWKYEKDHCNYYIAKNKESVSKQNSFALKSFVLKKIEETITIIDLGHEAYKDGLMDDILDIMDKVIVVSDVNHVEMGNLRECKQLRAKGNNPAFIINKDSPFQTRKSLNVSNFIGEDYSILVIGGKNADKEGRVYFADEKSREFFKKECLNPFMSSIKGSSNIKAAFKKIFAKKDNYMFVGTTEIGFMGLEPGIGTTHTALLCAYSLAGNYRVAYVEVGKFNNQMKDFIEAEFGEPGETENTDAAEGVSYEGVDLFSVNKYEEFSTLYKDDYDFVVIDFKTIPTDPFSIKEFLEKVNSCSKNILVASAAPWRQKALSEFYLLFGNMESMGKVVFAMPFATDLQSGKWLKTICEHHRICSVMYEPNYISPNPDVKEMFFSVLDIDRKISSGNNKKYR